MWGVLRHTAMRGKGSYMNVDIIKYCQLSYPRSGANYLRSIAREILHLDKHYLDADTEDDIYSKTHELRFLHDASKRSLIGILRNPLECLVRHKENIDRHNVADYLKVVNSFHSFAGPKHLIYYEDLILSPNIIISEFAKFLGHPDFTFNAEDLFNSSLTKYKVGGLISTTEGKNTVFHRKGLQHNKRWKEFIQDACPEDSVVLLNRYLQ